ncbi:MAG: hypothetical protein ACR2LK_09395 [Solirubrobacteraceae bacterium]
MDLPDLTIQVAGSTEPASSAIDSLGGYVVVVTTSLPDRGVTLVSVYLSALGGDSAASHLAMTPGHDARLQHRLLTGLQPGSTHARGCMLDHAAELQQLLADLTASRVSVDAGATALQRAADIWQH